MSLNSIPKTSVQGNVELGNAVRELQGLNITRVAGALANTKINIAAMRLEDTILYAEYTPTTFADPVVLATTIQDTHATGTVTFATAIEGSTFAVDGVTYTVTATVTADTHILLGGTDAQMADKAVVVVNNKEKQRGTNYNKRNQRVVASSTGASGVVTFTAVDDGIGNGAVITGSSHITAATSGTASATLTVSSSIANADTFVVHGVTFTFKTTPVAGVLTDVQVTASDATASALAGKNAINTYNSVHGFTYGVTATVLAGVITLVPSEPKTGNIIALAGTVTVLAASGATLSGGTATGGFKTATATNAGTVLVMWINKR